jgi:hypothetical protein
MAETRHFPDLHPGNEDKRPTGGSMQSRPLLGALLERWQTRCIEEVSSRRPDVTLR